jgi:predicted ATPase
MYSNLVFCSGRGEEQRAVTEKWLADNKFTYEGLYMRAAGDYRQDSIVKVELLEQIREKHGEPYLWIDDRNQVVDAIREQGIRVIQVAQGDF